jgi:uncharacterized repeat protein (TIGR01451 family)
MDHQIRTGFSRRERHESRRRRLEVERLEGRALLTTFTVMNANDSGAGSLRNAITQLNSDMSAGTDTINFQIGTGGLATISLMSPLPNIGHAVIIDGTTQSGFLGKPLIVLNGSALNSTLDISGLEFTADGNTVKGLVINGFPRAAIFLLTTNGNTIQGNFLGTDASGTSAVPDGSGVEAAGQNNLIGGTTAAARNVISGNSVKNGTGGEQVGPGFGDGIYLFGRATKNTIEGNFIGTNAAGNASIPNEGTAGVELDTAPGNTVGGATAGAGNVISGNAGDGIFVRSGSDRTTIQGNRIGSNLAGDAAILSPNSTSSNLGDGIDVFSSSNMIGGVGNGLGNVVAASNGDAILLEGGGNTVIQGNFLGTDPTGTLNLGNRGGAGVHINGSTDNSIGGTDDPRQANVIAFNFLGVDIRNVGGPGTGNAVLSNSIFSNSPDLGIDLNNGLSHGVTMNTPGGPHMGPNDFQNFPVLTSASIAGGVATISGTLNSIPSGTFLVQFFANPVADPSGFGQGKTLLGSRTVSTDTSGNVSFSNLTFPTSAPAGSFITSTATSMVPDFAGDTSEFSKAIATAVAANTADLSINGTAPASVTLGNSVTYALTVANGGPNNATGVKITDTLPAGVTFVSATGGVTPNEGVLTFNLGNLASGANTTVMIVVTPTAAGMLTNRATVQGNENDPTSNDNTSVLPTTVTAPVSDGPRIISLVRTGFHLHPTHLILTFNRALDPARADFLGNYLVQDAHGNVIPLRAATYNPATNTVTLDPAVLINLHFRIRVTVRGTGPNGLTDASGILLDGAGTGHPGSDYVAALIFFGPGIPI